jgi:uncharacterized Tic20 family protein
MPLRRNELGDMLSH